MPRTCARSSQGPEPARRWTTSSGLLRLGSVPAPVTREIEKARTEDRRLTIWAQRVTYDGCDTAVLSAAAKALRAAGR